MCSRSAKRRLSLDDRDAKAHLGLAVAHSLRWQHDRALHHMERAVALNPNDDLVAAEHARLLTGARPARRGIGAHPGGDAAQPLPSELVLEHRGPVPARSPAGTRRRSTPTSVSTSRSSGSKPISPPATPCAAGWTAPRTIASGCSRCAPISPCAGSARACPSAARRTCGACSKASAGRGSRTRTDPGLSRSSPARAGPPRSSSRGSRAGPRRS